MSSFSPVFLICSERCGSNLIRVMMDAHSQVAAPPPLHLLRRIFGNCAELVDENGPSKTWLIARRRVGAALTRYYGEDFSDEVVEELSNLKDLSPESVVHSLYRRLAEYHGASVLMVKENNIHRYNLLVMNCFPDAKFIFQVRDPRDYLASARALRKGRWGNKFGSTRNALEIWREDQEFGLRALSQLGAERVFLQRYEDLITQPEAVLTSLCSFVGLPFDRAMLDYHSNERTQKSANMGSQWKNLGKELISDNSGKYRKTLSKQDIRTTEVYLGHLMERFGYELDYPERNKARFRDVFWPMLLEPIERWSNNKLEPRYSLQGKGFEKEILRAATQRKFSYASATSEVGPFPEARLQGPSLGTDSPRHALARVVAAAEAHPERPALRIDGEDWTYRELLSAAASVAARLGSENPAPSLRVAIYADKSTASYVGILATLLCGGTYVPVNPSFPQDRQRNILERSGVTQIVVSEARDEALAQILDGGPSLRRVTIPTQKREFFRKQPSGAWPPALPSVTDDSLAYLLFTSGSTGEPKGVAITQGNLASYLHAAFQHINAVPSDRFSQTFELTFDLSVHDLFICWSSGSCLVVPSEDDLLSPGNYIERENITQWFSVPSLAHRMRLVGELRSDRFPSIKMSLFCGEALPAGLAEAWLEATPEGAVENWYGPTEATIACTRYPVTSPFTAGQAEELVPIGSPLAGMTTLICDQSLHPTLEGVAGDLYLAGPQLAEGYVDDEVQTEKCFVSLPGQEGRYYRTGDRAVLVEGELLFIGRSDNQVKVRGFRIELGDVERGIRGALHGANCVALAWPPDSANPEYLLGAVEGAAQDVETLMGKLSELLPEYMIPANLLFLDRFPTNASGKTDRRQVGKKIAQMLDRSSSGSDTAEKTHAERLLEAIHSVNPSLAVGRIESAESLLAAGMDSMGFVRLTLELEKRFGAQLNHETVASMSQMPFYDLVRFLSTGSAEVPKKRPNENSDVLDLASTNRANRSVQFVENFPKLVNKLAEKPGPPLWLLLGTSGTMRAISPSNLNKVAAQAGVPMRSVNAGLLQLSCEGMVPVCEFIRRTLDDAGVRAAGIVLELDPMQICVLFRSGDGKLPDAVFTGKVKTKPLGSLNAEFEWDWEKFGHVEFEEERIFKRQRAAWEKRREKVVMDTYAGRVEFHQSAIDAWVECGSILRDVSETLVGFVHPIRNYSDLSIQGPGANLFESALEQLEQRTRIRFILPADFDISEASFIDVNHINPWDGSRKLNRQLFHWLQRERFVPSKGED